MSYKVFPWMGNAYNLYAIGPGVLVLKSSADVQSFMRASSMLDRSPREASAARNDWRVLKRAINITDSSIMHARYQYMKREMRAYVST